MRRVVFDIGGTHIRVARANGDEIADEVRENTPQDPTEALERLLALVAQHAGEEAVAVAGGVAGSITHEGAIRVSPNLSHWNGLAVGEKLRAQFGTQVYVRNDAHLAGVGEAVVGAGRDKRVVAYVGIGTGVGGALIADGAAVPHAVGFEPGQHILDASSGATFESLVGGAAVEKLHGAPPPELPQAVFDALTPTVAAGLWNAVVHWSPEVLVLGGSMMSETRGFRVAAVGEALTRAATMAIPLPDVRPVALGDAAGLRGAAVFLDQQLKNAEK